MLSAWLGSRLWLAIFVYLGHFSRGDAPLPVVVWKGVPNFWLNAWTTFDSRFFLEIAAGGYNPTNSPFFPLYPLLLAPFGPDPNRMALAGIVISNLAFGGALWILFDLTRRQYDEKVARIAVWTLAFFPCAAYGGALYSESLWLLLGLASLWHAHRGRWVAAGLFGLAAALTRNSGPLLTLALLAYWWQSPRGFAGSTKRDCAHNSQRNLAPNAPTSMQGSLTRRARWGWAWALLPGLAFVAMQFYFRAQFGALLSSVANQNQFGRAVFWPWIPLWRDFADIATLQHLDIVTMLNFGGVVATFVLAGKFRRVQPRGDAILLCGVVLLNLIFAHIWRPYTGASLRYLFGLWPFSQLLALQIAQAPPRTRVMLSIFALALSACLSFLFGAKAFLG